MVSSSAMPEVVPPELNAVRTVAFRNGSQRAEVSLPASKAAFMVMADTWPQAIEVDRLCVVAIERAAAHLEDSSREEAHRGLMGDLFGAVMYGMVHVHTEPPVCTNQLSDTPRAYRLAAYQAEHGTTVVNAHHQMIELEPLGARVLRFANGERSTGE